MEQEAIISAEFMRVQRQIRRVEAQLKEMDEQLRNPSQDSVRLSQIQAQCQGILIGIKYIDYPNLYPGEQETLIPELDKIRGCVNLLNSSAQRALKKHTDIALDGPQLFDKNARRPPALSRFFGCLFPCCSTNTRSNNDERRPLVTTPRA